MMNARRFPPGHLPAIRLASPGVAAALILACGGCAKAPAPAAPPPTVTVVTVEQRNVPVTQEWVASLYGYVDAQVRAQVSGYLLKQDYRDGATVRAGDPLFEIDPRPFQAALAQAGKAEDDVRRYGPLAKDQAISQQEMDDAVQAELGAKAQVAAGQAAVDRAQLDLGFTHLQSPISGVAGIVQAQVGDLVGPGTGALTTVSTLDPMKVYFPIGEQDYLELGRAQGGGFPPNAVLELILGDGSVYP
jgi:membrane fusion protein (multidrug efflux system)